MARADTAQPSDAFVHFAGVQKTYDGQSLVVKNLELGIARGELVTLLGPSGSGKTTCLLMLAGFEAPSAGEIFLDGRPISRMPPYRRDIGMVFQSYALFPHMTVAENIAFPLQVRKVPSATVRDRVKRALAMIQLEGLENRRPAQLSGGQQQRVALARALVFEPKLVLMDEPLGALDKQLRETMQYEIKHLHDRLGVTIIHVTHDQSEALTMSDRVAVFDDGILQQLATPEELYERPANAFVARFIGESNRLPGIIRERFAERCAIEVGGQIVHAVPVTSAGGGSAALLSIRPERILVNSLIGGYDNQFDGIVQDVVFHGDHTRARVSLLGCDDFIVKLPNRQGQLRPQPGQTIRCAWQADDCRALDAG